MTVFSSGNLVIIVTPPLEIHILAEIMLILCRMYLRIGGCVVFLVKFLHMHSLQKKLLIMHDFYFKERQQNPFVVIFLKKIFYEFY